jgi:predicted nuclease of predicted toxin-antitoxin system
MNSEICDSGLTSEQCDEYLRLFLSHDGYRTVGKSICDNLFASTARVYLRKNQVVRLKELDWDQQSTALSTLEQDTIRDEVTRTEIGKRLNHFAARKVRRSLNRHLSKGGVVLSKDVTVFATGERNGQIVISLVDAEMLKLHRVYDMACELLLLRGDSIPAIASGLVLRLTLGCVSPLVWECYFTPTTYRLKGCQKPQAPTRRKIRFIYVSSPLEAMMSSCALTPDEVKSMDQQ